MISIQGHLAIKTIVGRFGPFNVGRLTTDVGEFSVKDEKLEQFEEGSYDGTFQISRFKTSTYSYGGRTITELQVELYDFDLDDMDELSSEEGNSIGVTQTVDPVEEEALSPKTQPVEAKPAQIEPDKREERDSVADAASEPSDEASVPDNADEALFGLLWPLGDVVVLDASVGRMKVREQRARLLKLGYVINFKTQKWHKGSVPAEEAEGTDDQF